MQSTGGRVAAAAGRAWRVGRRHGVAAGVLLALGLLTYRLALAPVHGVRDAAGCARAYAAARTRADTLSAGFLSYPDSAGRGVRRRCGDLYPTPARITGR